MNLIKKYYHGIFFTGIFTLLLFLPMVLVGHLYYVGGDDTRLYYLFPDEFIKNFAVNIVSDNALGGANTGYGTAAHFIPFVLVVSVLKKLLPFVNIQFLMYGMNYAFAFLFFYLFLSIWVKHKDHFSFFAKVVASLFYVLSPFLVGTLYKHQLTSIYLVSLMPIMLYFFSRAVIDGKYIYSIVAALLFSIFSTTLNTTPWSLPIVITGLPLFIYLFWKNKKSFLINSAILLLFVFALNFYWLFHFINSNINNMGVASSADYYSTEEYNRANIQGVFNLTRIMNPLVPLFQSVDYKFRQNFSLIQFKNIIFIFIVILGGVFAAKPKDKRLADIYWISLIGFLLSWFLFSPNFGNWGPEYFISFIRTIPFGIMFRNMFDKFALPLAFHYSFALAAALTILGQTLHKTVPKKILLIVLIVVIVSNSYFFIKPKTEIEGVNGTITGEFNQDFSDLIDYLRSMDNASRILWVPITAPNYVTVEDKNYPSHFYSGLSPLRILANRSDYSGRYSFMLPSDVFYGDKIFKLLADGDYDRFAKEMQRLNARYLIFDKQLILPEMQPYLYDEDRKYLRYQDKAYRDFILGEKLKDFGSRYSLYLIRDDYMSDKVYLTHDYTLFPKVYENSTYKKQASYFYDVNLTNVKVAQKLVFLEVFNKEWTLYLKNDQTIVPYKRGENVLVHDWANGWEIDPTFIVNNYDESYYDINPDGSLNINFKLYFEPQIYNKKLLNFSVVVYALTIILMIVYFSVRFRNRMSK